MDEHSVHNGDKMNIEQYDEVILKNGERAEIVEVFPSGDFSADIGYDERTWDNINITIDDIDHKVAPGSKEGLKKWK